MSGTRHSNAESADVSDDALLLAQIARQDRRALEAFYFRHFQKLQRFARRITHSADLAEEVVNDTMMIVWQSAGTFRGESRVSTWLFGIAYRRALKSLARGPRTAAADAELYADPHLPADEAERLDWIETAMRCLSDEHRTVIELAYFSGFSCEEIAGIVDCPTGTVKTRLFYARSQLREQLLRIAQPSPPPTSKNDVA